MSLMSKLNCPRSWVSSSGKDISAFQEVLSSGKSTKSSIGLEGLKDGKLPCKACVVTRDNDGIEATGLGSSRPEEEVCVVEVDVRDMSLCDLR